MSAWGVAGGGPMNDQQIANVIAYLASIQIPMDGCTRGRDHLRDGHLPAGDPRRNPQPTPRPTIQRAAEAAVAAGTYKTLGEALFNLDLNGGAYSCARCHTKGWSYGDPQAVGRRGAWARTSPNGVDRPPVPERRRPGRLRRRPGSEQRQELRPAGPGHGPHARLRPAADARPRSRPSSTTSGASDVHDHAVLAVGWNPEHPRHPRRRRSASCVLCGSVYLLLGTNLGARLGFLVALAGLFGWLTLLGTDLVDLRHRPQRHGPRLAGPRRRRGRPSRGRSSADLADHRASTPTVGRQRPDHARAS